MMRRLWWLCGLVTFITAKGILSITFECDSGWIKRSYRCYKKFTASKSWYDARSACHNNGGCLASITDSSQDYFISQNFGSTQIWLGGSDETKEGQWTWIDTEDTFSYTNWRPSYTVKGGWWNSDKRYAAQPDNDGNEDCLAMYSPSISNRWNDRSCFNTLDYVCMMGAKILPSLTPTSCECTTGECHIGSVLGKSKCTYTDVLFLIDNSGSMSKEWFTYSLNIAGKLMECMTIGPDEIRVSLMTFSSSTSMILDFDTYKTKEITKAAILNAPYRGSPESKIGQAMNNVRNVLQVNDINRLHIAIILTDGRTEGSINAQQLRSESIFVFAMGVGNYNQFNSDIFATNTTSEYIANPNDYFDIHQKVKKRINALCIDEMRPHIMSCEMEIHDSSGNKAQSPVIGSSECVNQQDFYGKYQVSAFSSHVMISGEYSSTMPNASIEDFHFGISEGLIEMLKRNKSELDLVLGQHIFHSSSNYTRMVAKDVHVNVTNDLALLSDTDRFCLKYKAYAGGFVRYRGKNYVYGNTENVRTLCYIFDNVAPRHCQQLTNCIAEPLILSDEVTSTQNINVTFIGWGDFSSEGSADMYSSKIRHFQLYLHEMEYGNGKLKMKTSSLLKNSLCYNCTNLEVKLPNSTQPMLYAVVLEVVDIAWNSRQARRFILYHSFSKLRSHPQMYLNVTSAEKNTNFRWQTNHRNVCYSWVDKYYNDKFIHYNPLSPIDSGVHDHFQGIYEQRKGLFSVSGTPNINGVILFRYSLQKDGVVLAENQVVPDFQNQSMCIEVPTLADGETLLYNLTAIDIVKNEYQDSVTHFIDASPPTITDLWLTLNGYERIFTHYEADLSKMKLNFKAYDSHSGIAHVLWYLRKSSGGEIIGHGTIGVSRLTTTPNCSTPFNCYCPSVGLCENLDYTLDLNSLIANNSHHGQHNRQYVFEIQVINNANLMHSETKSILVDESAPERGVVQEGVAEGPDIDFTATNIVDVNWKGFIDHESGIKFYRLATANSCLTSDELSDQSSTLQYIDTEDLSMTVTLNVTGKMYTSVIAYNNALEPSIAACSDGIVWDKTPPLIRNITIADMHIVPTFVCFKGSVYLINENVRKVLTPCLCESKIQNDFVQYLPQEQKSNCYILPSILYTTRGWH